RITAEAWVIDAACVSSKSSPCASVPLTRIASGTGAVRVVPTTVHSPPPSPARSITAGVQSPRDDASAMPSTSSVRSRTLAAAARAREVGVDHALVVDLRVEPDVVRVCEETRRPIEGRATVWRQAARVVRAADGGERLRAEVTTPDVEADCEESRPSARRRGVQATATAAVERLVGKLLAP